MNRLNFRKPLAYGYKNITFWLIGANVLVFIILYARNSMALFVNLSLSADGLRNGKIWELFTYMFVHGSPQHLFFNMLGLFFFGVQVERTMGSFEYLAFYFVTGILSGLTAFIIYYLTGTNVLLLGASGAIFAILFAFAMYYPNARILLFFILPVNAVVLVLLYTGFELFSHIFGTRGGVGHLAHLAGFGFAWLYFLLRLKINPLNVFRNLRNRPYH